LQFQQQKVAKNKTFLMYMLDVAVYAMYYVVKLVALNATGGENK
jgi:hypothetical protein